MKDEDTPVWNATRHSAGPTIKNVTKEVARFATGYSPINATVKDKYLNDKFLTSGDLLDALSNACMILKLRQ